MSQTIMEHNVNADWFFLGWRNIGNIITVRQKTEYI